MTVSPSSQVVSPRHTLLARGTHSRVTGGNGGIGLEMALALCEAGARAVYCLDLNKERSPSWIATRDYVEKMNNGSRLEYVSVDVTNQPEVWGVVEKIADKEGRMDICVAAAGILKPNIDCLEYPAEEFRHVMDVNTNGVLFSAQAAGRQMRRFKTPGSIVMIASMSGTLQNRVRSLRSTLPHPSSLTDCGRRDNNGYRTTRASQLYCRCAGAWRASSRRRGSVSTRSHQGTFTHRAFPHIHRSLPRLIPVLFHARLTALYLDKSPEMLDHWSNLNPMGRIGRLDEMRGIIAWLASDASTYCTGSEYVGFSCFIYWVRADALSCSILIDGGHHAW